MSGRLHLPPMPTIREIIRVYKLGAIKRLSQNFLLDENICNKIVKHAGKGCRLSDSWVCEVGPGPGGITRAILRRNPEKLVLIEKDSRFIPGLEMLNAVSGGRVSIYHGDVLRFNMEEVIPPDKGTAWDQQTPNIHLIGNLPFNVSTPLIIRWLEMVSQRSGPWKFGRVRMTLTFQKEVCERMTAGVGDVQRSRLSVMTQYLCDVRKCFTMPGRVFVPEPDVDVSLVHLVPHIMPHIDVPFKYVEKVVRHVFHYRQKYIKHGVQTLYYPDRHDLTREMFNMADVDPETTSFLLSISDFRRMAQVYQKQCESNPGLFEFYYRATENTKAWRNRQKVQL